MYQHGGDIYTNEIKCDFSVNVNPLGMPENVKKALLEAVSKCATYPDIDVRQLKEAIAKSHCVKDTNILCGNGASELMMAIVHAIRPERILIPVPSFYGYEYVANATDAEVCFFSLKEKDAYCVREDILNVLTSDIDLLMLASPNNPVGNVLDLKLLFDIFDCCKKNNIYVLLDQCFADFIYEPQECKNPDKDIAFIISQYPNVILLRAFTKTYAIPGVRLGYLLCGDDLLCDKISKQLPEWNVSTFAQAAGIAALESDSFVRKSAKYVEEERALLAKELRVLGMKVFASRVNYILVQTELDLYKLLLANGVLIRDCSNYRGLGKGYYRIAVKTRKENEMLVETIKKCLKCNGR